MIPSRKSSWASGGEHYLIAVLVGAGIEVGLARVYVEYLLYPGTSVYLVYAYLAFAGAVAVAALWYQAYRVNPRILGFVQSLSGWLRDAEFKPWGTRTRGLLAVFHNGLVMNIQKNLLSFRLIVRSDGTLLRPTLEELPSVFRSLRGARRQLVVSSKKGDAWQKVELERIRTLIGSRWALVLLFGQPEREGKPSSSPGDRTAVGLFFTPKWWLRGDGVRQASDDVSKFMLQLRTGLTG